jgi:membrane-bound lytic murein transglycosylase MltF
MFSRKILTLYIVLLALIIVIMGGLLYALSQKSSPRDLREIRAEGVLRIVTEYDQAGYYVSENQIEGFHYELSKAIARLSGLEVFIYLDMSLEESFEGLLSNHYDIVARNIPVTSELKEHYAFTDPIILSRQVLVQRTKEHNNGTEPLRNHLDLAEKTLYIPKGSPALLRLHNLQHEIGDTIYVVEEPLNAAEQLIDMVAEGDIEYAICDLQIALASQKQHPEIDIKTDISFTQLQSWAIRKDSPTLLDSLNHWLHTIRESGQFDTIMQQYYEY